MIKFPKIKRPGSARAGKSNTVAKKAMGGHDAHDARPTAVNSSTKPSFEKTPGARRLPDGRVPLKASAPKIRKPFVFGGRNYLAKTVPRGLDEMRANRLEAHNQVLSEGFGGFADMIRMASRPQAKQPQSGLKKAA